MDSVSENCRTMVVRSIRLMTWNVNGLRAVLQREKKKLKQFLDELDADILCFQETKLTRSELDEELVRPEGQSARCCPCGCCWWQSWH